jgi:hypothetical protein
MIDAIRFTRGAIAKKDYVPELTHYIIKDGRITGYNGVMSLSSPLDLDIDARPKASTFAKAVASCEDTISIHMTKAGRLSIKSGKFRALVDCLPEDTAMDLPVLPEGEDVDVGPTFMDAIRATAKYQGVDASRPWAMGLMFNGPSVLATNNVIFVEYWHGHPMPMPMNIPTVAIKELLRIGQNPIRVTANAHSATFHFEDDRWLKTQLVAQPWPETAMGLLDRQFDYQPAPEGLWDALRTIKPFIDKDERVHFRDGTISTSAVDELGAHHECDVPDGPVFAYKVLELLEGATHIDFSPYPNPCGFLADGMRGMFLGLRQ